MENGLIQLKQGFRQSETERERVGEREREGE